MNVKPYPAGTVCIVIVDPAGRMLGEEVIVLSEQIEIIGGGDGDWVLKRGTKGLPAQRIDHPSIKDAEKRYPNYRLTMYWPIAWMVPKGINPDPEVSTQDRVLTV